MRRSPAARPSKNPSRRALSRHSAVLCLLSTVLVLTALFLTALFSTASAAHAGEPLSKTTLLDLGRGDVDPDIILSLVQRDCVSFDVTAEVVLELSEALPKPVIQEAIECRERGGSRPSRGALRQNDETAPGDADAGHDADPIAGSGLDQRRLAVMPFTGSHQYQSLATETLIAELVRTTNLDIVQPESDESSSSFFLDTQEPATPAGEAQATAARAQAAYAVLGDINAYDGSGTLNALATLKLVDVESGAIVAVIQKKSGLLIAYSLQDCVVRAVKRASKELVPELKGEKGAD